MAELLIVDDDEDVVGSLADVAACEGHTVRIAHDGVEGLEQLRSSPVDLILLDVEMPRLTGPEMAYELFALNAGREKIPIVLLSGKVELARVAATVGTPYFIGKPPALDALLALLNRALAERTPPRPRFDAYRSNARH